MEFTVLNLALLITIILLKLNLTPIAELFSLSESAVSTVDDVMKGLVILFSVGTIIGGIALLLNPR